jgi:nuclear pore complex protein Nup62
MTFKQLEDNVNAWLTELNMLEQDFRQQAQTINTWDALLMNNSVKILEIDQKVEELKVENTKLDRALDFIVEQQQEIEKLLEPIERIKVNTNPNGERETTYNLVETVQNELHSLSDDLQSFVVKLNDLRSSDSDLDPITQIERILNAQIDSLQFIEYSVNAASGARTYNGNELAK